MPKANIHSLISQDLPPTILTIFGATGDLSSDYLLPALLHMSEHGLLPKTFKLVCVGRRPFTQPHFSSKKQKKIDNQTLSDALSGDGDLSKSGAGLAAKSYLSFILKKSHVLKNLSPQKRAKFLKHLIYHQGDFNNPESFAELAKILADKDKPKHQCYNRLFYFATKPQQFAAITKILQSSGLLMACAAHERKVRVLVEKPFGFNLKSAQSLNQLLLKFFTEEQIYRIDHYAGKETVQNLMVMRFANSLFEPLWNNRFIDHVEISVFEKDGAGGRIGYYDSTGAIRDFLQNHMLQMLALTAMDEPYNLTAEFIHNEKLKVLRALEVLTPEKLPLRIVKGQYKDYAAEVKSESSTETFFALKMYVNLPRWQGVPFYLKTGKRLAKKLTQISVHFREPVRSLFSGAVINVLSFQIQPDEAVHLQINTKIPGFGIHLHPANFEFGYKQTFKGEIPGAYERLLLDFLEGDQRLFIRSDEIEAAWKFVDSITENKQFKKLPLYKYAVGTNGPKEAEELIKKDFKEWWTR